MLAKILVALVKDSWLKHRLLFKWWTCALFFYDLPRLSVDLDFDLIDPDQEYLSVITSIEQILTTFWRIDDKADKHYTIFYEFNYGHGARNMKIEISKRGVSGWASLRNFFGQSLWIMNEGDLFANKLIALLHRSAITNRDIFDMWFFLQKGTHLNTLLIEQKLDISRAQYRQQIITFIQAYDFGKILYGLGELLTEEQKLFAKKNMKDEIVWYLWLLS